MASIEEEVFMDLYHAVKGAMRGVRRTFALARRLLRGRRRNRQTDRAPQIDAPGGSGPSNNGPQVDERVVEEQQDRRLDLHERRAMTEAVLVHLRNHPEHRAQLDSLTDGQRRELTNGLIDRALADDELRPDPNDLDGNRILDTRDRELADREADRAVDADGDRIPDTVERDRADAERDRADDTERETTEAEGTAEAAEREADEAEQTAEDREKTREAEAREEDGERREGPDAADAVPAAAVVAAEGLDADQPETDADRDGQNQPETSPQAEADQDGRGADEPAVDAQAETDRDGQGVDEPTVDAQAEADRDGRGVDEPAADAQAEADRVADEPATDVQADANRDGQGVDEPTVDAQAEADRDGRGGDEPAADAQAEADRDGLNQPTVDAQADGRNQAGPDQQLQREQAELNRNEPEVNGAQQEQNGQGPVAGQDQQQGGAEAETASLPTGGDLREAAKLREAPLDAHLDAARAREGEMKKAEGNGQQTASSITDADIAKLDALTHEGVAGHTERPRDDRQLQPAGQGGRTPGAQHQQATTQTTPQQDPERSRS